MAAKRSKRIVVTTTLNQNEIEDFWGIDPCEEYLNYIPYNVIQKFGEKPVLWINFADFSREPGTLEDQRAQSIDYFIERLSEELGDDSEVIPDTVVITVFESDFLFYEEYFKNTFVNQHKHKFQFYNHVPGAVLPKDLYIFRPETTYDLDTGFFILLAQEIQSVFRQFFDGRVTTDDFDDATSKVILN